MKLYSFQELVSVGDQTMLTDDPTKPSSPEIKDVGYEEKIVGFVHLFVSLGLNYT